MTDLLSTDEQLHLLAVAREALVARVTGLPAPAGDGAGASRGAFVTLRKDGCLRGCLGRVAPDAPLVATVSSLAAAAATADTRFDPVRAGELNEIDIEISVLTPARPIQSVDEIVVGRHGLIVERGGRRGLLLPQVATDHGWDAATFVAHTCLKAGLPADAWQQGAQVLVFEAQVFGETTATAPAPPSSGRTS